MILFSPAQDMSLALLGVIPDDDQPKNLVKLAGKLYITFAFVSFHRKSHKYCHLTFNNKLMKSLPSGCLSGLYSKALLVIRSMSSKNSLALVYLCMLILFIMVDRSIGFFTTSV